MLGLKMLERIPNDSEGDFYIGGGSAVWNVLSRQLKHIAITFLLFIVAVGTVFGQDERPHVVEFCRTEGKIEVDSSLVRTAEWRDRIVREFLKYAAMPGDISLIDYCDSSRTFMMDDSTHVSVDCVTFTSCDMTLAKWLNEIPENTYIEYDIPAEAPERSVAFRRASTIVIVWCNLFADSDEVFKLVDISFLEDVDGYRDAWCRSVD